MPFLASLLIILAVIVFFVLLLGIRWIPNTRVGIVEKLLSPRGSIQSGVIALKGEAGFQPHLLRGGLHYLIPFQYSVHMAPLVTIPQGRIGYVYARDGKTIVYCSHILDVVERVCERVIIIHEGRIVADGTTQQLRDQAGEPTLERVFNKLTATENLLARAEEFARVLSQ